MDLVERLVWHHDQPFGDSSAMPTFILSELTRGHVTVALCGDGGDELFAGYERFGAAVGLERLRRLPGAVRSLMARSAGLLPRTAFHGRAASAQAFVAAIGTEPQDAHRHWAGLLNEPSVGALVRDGSPWAIDDYGRIWSESAGAPLLDRLLNLNLRTYLLDDLLPKVDRTSMAHALEVRSPFLDTALVEYALLLPPDLKLHRLTLKRVLKRAFAGVLPGEILNRRKRGFGVPLDRWFRADLKPLVASTLGARDARVRSHLVGSGVDRMLAEHESGAADHGHPLWALLTLELFLRREGW